MKTNYYFINNDSRFINIAGDDRQDFLQGLITNDVKVCNRNNPIYACILSPQGKFLADFFVIELDGSYLIEIHNQFFDNKSSCSWVCGQPFSITYLRQSHFLVSIAILQIFFDHL